MNNNSFSIISCGDVRLISVDCINQATDYRAYYSTGFGGVSDMPGGCSMNLSMFKKCPNDNFENVKENFRIFADACGFDLHSMSLHREVHESHVAVVVKEDLPTDPFDREQYTAADGQVTRDQDIALFVYSGDCSTFLLVDPINRVHAATHCGWRNSLNGTLQNFIFQFMLQGGELKNATIVQGPGISKYYYDVDEQAAAIFFARGYADCLERNETNGRWFIDLAAINEKQLISLGFSKEQIHTAPYCTSSSTDLRLPSYRRDKGSNANMGGVIFRAN